MPQTAREQLAGKQLELAASWEEAEVRGVWGWQGWGGLSQGLLSRPAPVCCAGPSKAGRGEESWWKTEEGVVKSYTWWYDSIAVLNGGK